MPKDPQQIVLSVLMLSIPSRVRDYVALQDKLMSQIGERQDVEVLCLVDNKSLHIFEKRNEVMRIARGRYLAWLDDDDDVAENYIARITETIEANPGVDVISFNQHSYLNGKHVRIFARMGNPHEKVTGPDGELRDTLRPPYHWCVWRSTLAKSEEFRSAYAKGGQSCEDIDWLKRLYPKVERSVALDDFLHIYRWSYQRTESVLR